MTNPKYLEGAIRLASQAPGIHHVTVSHDRSCRIFDGGACTCNPDIARGVPAKTAVRKTPMDHFNDLCRLADGGDRLCQDMRLDETPLYHIESLTDILFNCKYQKLLCTVPRKLLLLTDTRCVCVEILGDGTVLRLERGAKYETQRFRETENGIAVLLPGGAVVEFREPVFGEIEDYRALPEPQRQAYETRTNALVIIAMLNHIDSPRNYVICEEPTRNRVGGKKTARYENRERFIVLDKDAVIKKYRERVDHGGTHASPAPHLRRGHYMTLKADRYVNMKGQRIPIRPSWVGSRMWAGKNGLRYRVVSRPGSSESQA